MDKMKKVLRMAKAAVGLTVLNWTLDDIIETLVEERMKEKEA